MPKWRDCFRKSCCAFFGGYCPCILARRQTIVQTGAKGGHKRIRCWLRLRSICLYVTASHACRYPSCLTALFCLQKYPAAPPRVTAAQPFGYDEPLTGQATDLKILRLSPLSSPPYIPRPAQSYLFPEDRLGLSTIARLLSVIPPLACWK